MVIKSLASSALAPYLYGGFFLLLVAGSIALWMGGSRSGQAKGKAAVAEQLEDQYRGELAAARAEAKLARELNMDLVSRLARVPTDEAVKEAVRENPSNCPTAPAVGDSLRNQAAAANASRTAGKRNGQVPPAR